MARPVALFLLYLLCPKTLRPLTECPDPLPGSQSQPSTMTRGWGAGPEPGGAVGGREQPRAHAHALGAHADGAQAPVRLPPPPPSSSCPPPPAAGCRLTADGRLAIPTPGVAILKANRSRWKEKSAVGEAPPLCPSLVLGVEEGCRGGGAQEGGGREGRQWRGREMKLEPSHID